MRTIDPERTILTIKDMLARETLLRKKEVVVGKSLIYINDRIAKMNALVRDCFEREELWVNVIGLPHHMWNWKNGEMLGLKVGEELLEVDRDCLNMVRLDMLRITVRVEKEKRGSHIS